LKFPTTTSRESILHNHWDLVTYGGGKECLSKTIRPGFVSTVRPDLSQTTYRIKEEDTLHTSTNCLLLIDKVRTTSRGIGTPKDRDEVNKREVSKSFTNCLFIFNKCCLL
jgi:hypothetical protein